MQIGLFKQRIALQRQLDLLLKLKRGQLQQADRLLELRSHGQLLAEPELQTLLHSLLSTSVNGVAPARRRSEAELFAQINAFYLLVGQNSIRRAVGNQFAPADDVGAFTYVQRLAHVVVGDQHARAAVTQVLDDF